MPNTNIFARVMFATLVALPVMQAVYQPAFAQPGPPPGEGPPPGQAGGGHDGMGPPGGPGGPHGPSPLAGLSRAEADKVAADTIAALASAPLADVQRVVRAWDVPTALRYFDVAPKAFHDASVPRLVAVVQAAAQDQRISAADADRVIAELQHEPPPPPPRER